MRAWKRVKGPRGVRFISELEPEECAVLRNMATSIREMLDDRQSEAPADPLEQITGIRTGNASAPENATMQRLLPDFVREDSGAPPGSDSALRSMHEPEIIDAKIAAAQRVLDTIPTGGGVVELGEDDAEAWIAALNDMRLALGTLLDIGPDTPEIFPAGDPRAPHLGVYQWLTGLQEYLVLGLMGKPLR